MHIRSLSVSFLKMDKLSRFFKRLDIYIGCKSIWSSNSIKIIDISVALLVAEKEQLVSASVFIIRECSLC